MSKDFIFFQPADSPMHSSPLYVPVDGANIGNMNWAVVIVGAEMLFSGAYWVYAARHKYMKESPVMSDSFGVIHGKAAETGTEVVNNEISKKA